MEIVTLRLGDAGVRLGFDVVEKIDDVLVPVDLTGYTLTARFLPPDNVLRSKTAIVAPIDFEDAAGDGTDGRAMYETEVGFLDQLGAWVAEVRATSGSKQYTSEPIRFLVKELAR